METVAWRAVDPVTELPEDAVPEFELRIVSYIDEEGESMYCYSATDGMPISQAVGLLGMVGHVLEHRIFEMVDEEEDDDED